MRLWKVNTRVDLTIVTNLLFKKNLHSCYFTYKTKYIYAKDIDDAKRKYEDYFFISMKIEDTYNKDILKMMKWTSETQSDNMVYELSFNQKIVSSHEWIHVSEGEVIANISEIKNNSTCNDFRDWFMNGVNADYPIEDLEWLDK
jgi:hypothetical protein